MIFLLHGKKISKEFIGEIIDFINELNSKKITILFTESFYEYFKKHNNAKIKTISNIDILNLKIDYFLIVLQYQCQMSL